MTKQETLEVKRNYEKHSLTKTKGYKLWCNIIQRCYNPKNHSYKYYGEKGVIMEDYFKNSYENFINWIKGIANYEKWLNSSELSRTVATLRLAGLTVEVEGGEGS